MNSNKDDRTYKIIGAAMEVHKEMGSGFLEAVYQECLGIELIKQQIPYKSQCQIELFYKEQKLSKYYVPDFLIYEEIIVEIKAQKKLTNIDEAQLINSLKCSGKKVGLLINFGESSLTYKRFINS